jgi:competence protein ComEC
VRPARAALLLPAVSFAAGILFSDLLLPERVPLLAGLAVLIPLWLCAIRRSVWLRSSASAAVMLVTGALTAEWQRPGPPPELDAEPGETLLISGCITEPVEADGVQSRFVVELEPHVRIRVTLTARPGEQLPRLAYGRVVEVQARVRKPRNFRNPGAFDYAGYMARRNIYWTGTARGVANARTLDAVCGSRLRGIALATRDGVTARVQDLFRGDEYVRRLLPALLTGDNSTLDRSWTDDFRRTGTYHALVVSGLHIAVLCGSLLFFLRVLRLPLGWTLVTAAGLAWCYAAVVNWQAPVVRSAAGFTLFLIARWFFRRGSVLNILSVVGIVLLALDPLALYDPGFQLTFLSVAAIGALAAPASERLLRPYTTGLRKLGETVRDNKLPPHVAEWRIELRLLAETAHLYTRIPFSVAATVLSAVLGLFFWVCETVLLSFCVQVALAVPLILYFHSLSLTGVLANVTVVPALSAAVPLGLIACATGLRLLTFPTQWLLNFARSTTEFWASIEPGVRIPDPPLWLVGFTAVAVAGASAALLAGLRRSAVLAWVPVIIAMCLLVAPPFVPAFHPGQLELTCIDVGQGDSLLLISPEGQTLLTDGGGSPAFDPRIRPRLDIGEDVVSPYLWRRGFSRLDAVAVSHLHEDHAGGMLRIIQNFRPSELWVGAVAPSRIWSELQAACRRYGVRIVRMRRGDSRPFGSAKIRVLSPAPAYQPAEAPRNNDSLVLLLTHGRHRFLLTGDVEEAIEADLAAITPEVDVLKVAHHGSRTSTTTAFLGAARPLFSIISVGADNPYGLPSVDTIERLRQAGSRIERTDEQGLVTIRTDGTRLSVENFAGSLDGRISSITAAQY